MIEANAGVSAGFSGDDYFESGVDVANTAAALWKSAIIVALVRRACSTRTERPFDPAR
ncbi:MAG: hypothetical protein OEY05_00180 [Paracoccaceae bacterium]|nr:hypothetical protein [Paracoccaceae bacterium]